MSDDTILITEVVSTVDVADMAISTIAILEDSETTLVLDDSITENLDIYEEPEDTIDIVDSGITPGPQGPAGIDATAPTPTSCEILRTDGEITSIVYEDGKTVTITRTDGEITSVSDGTYTKTIIREDNEIIGVQVNG